MHIITHDWKKFDAKPAKWPDWYNQCLGEKDIYKYIHKIEKRMYSSQCQGRYKEARRYYVEWQMAIEYKKHLLGTYVVERAARRTSKIGRKMSFNKAVVGSVLQSRQTESEMQKHIRPAAAPVTRSLTTAQIQDIRKRFGLVDQHLSETQKFRNQLALYRLERGA